MSDFKKLFAVLMAGVSVFAIGGPAAASAVGEDHPLLTVAAVNLADRAEADVVAVSHSEIVSSGLDLGFQRLDSAPASANERVRRSGVDTAVVEVASTDPTFPLSAAVDAMAGALDPLCEEPRPADTVWVVPASGPVQSAVPPARPIVFSVVPVITETEVGPAETVLASVLAALRRIRDLIRAGVHQTIASE